MAEFYGLDDLNEAEAYLRDPILRGRLLAASSVALDQVRVGTRLTTLMGSEIDLLKLVSSLTLFAALARSQADADDTGECERLADAAESLLEAARAEGYRRCAFTEQRLAEGRP